MKCKRPHTLYSQSWHDLVHQELAELQAAVERANEQLEQKVRHFDHARDTELDIIEMEKDSLQERIRQDK